MNCLNLFLLIVPLSFFQNKRLLLHGALNCCRTWPGGKCRRQQKAILRTNTHCAVFKDGGQHHIWHQKGVQIFEQINYVTSWEKRPIGFKKSRPDMDSTGQCTGFPGPTALGSLGLPSCLGKSSLIDQEFPTVQPVRREHPLSLVPQPQNVQGGLFKSIAK